MLTTDDKLQIKVKDNLLSNVTEIRNKVTRSEITLLGKTVDNTVSIRAHRNTLCKIFIQEKHALAKL